ncbi:MAG: S1-like domain-containing RNA-binding protein [Flavipsychrobacter sp.]|nr:S1-like domain-containing RNA-binding protein [Flavipsychrobacter sp.]
MVQVGNYNKLKVVKEVDFGFYLDGDGTEILLPKRFVPARLKVDDELDVFIYHDNDGRLTATTQKPLGVVGDIVMMKVRTVTHQGAFLDWGLMKDIFVPISQQEVRMKEGQSYLVMIYVDEQTGRAAATAKFSKHISNQDLTVKVHDLVDLVVYQKTDLGYKVIINNKHMGLLHFNEVFQDLEEGQQLKGFIKTIRPDNKIDVVPGQRGFKKVEDSESKILRLLKENNNYLPYNDKSDPEAIYSFFEMSKKTFKMTLGTLYKQQKINITQTGFSLNEED